MRRVILASHGDLAKGAQSSLEMIAGVGEKLTVYGMYPGDSASDTADALEKEIVGSPETEFVIVTDLFGASVCNAMYPLTRYKNVRLFAGFNLQFLLELLLGDEEPLTEAAAEQLVGGARAGLRRVTAQAAETAAEEDF